MPRPTNYPKGVTAADYAPQWVWSDFDQKDVWHPGLPETNPTCSCCDAPGDDNYWGLARDENEMSVPKHCAIGTLSQACAIRLAAENNKFEYFDLLDDLPPE